MRQRAPRRGPRRTLRAATEVRCAPALRGATPRRGARPSVRFGMRVVCEEQLDRPNGCRRWPRRAVRSGRTGRRGGNGHGPSLPPKTLPPRPLACFRGGIIHCATRFELIGSVPPRMCRVQRWKLAIRRRRSSRITEPWPPRAKARRGSLSNRTHGHNRYASKRASIDKLTFRQTLTQDRRSRVSRLMPSAPAELLFLQLADRLLDVAEKDSTMIGSPGQIAAGLTECLNRRNTPHTQDQSPVPIPGAT